MPETMQTSSVLEESRNQLGLSWATQWLLRQMLVMQISKIDMSIVAQLDTIYVFLWLQLEFESFAAGGWVDGRTDGRVPNLNATSGPQLTDEAEFSSVELVS